MFGLILCRERRSNDKDCSSVDGEIVNEWWVSFNLIYLPDLDLTEEKTIVLLIEKLQNSKKKPEIDSYNMETELMFCHKFKIR